MKTIYLAQPHGFCNGVIKALALIDEALAKNKKIYVLNEIVHNKVIVEKYKQQGVVFVKNVNEVPVGGTVVFSAHGVSPQVRDEAALNDLEVIDATCPIVQRVHNEVLKYAREGYHLIYIGHHKHEEVIGVYQEAPEHITIVEAEADFSKIPHGHKQYVVLSQTTLNANDVMQLIEKLRTIIPNLKGQNKGDICYATTARQDVVQRLARQVQAFIIIGSLNSSNSVRLKEIAAMTNIPAYLIDTPSDIQPTWLSNIENLGLSAGASAPEYLVQETLEFLKQKFEFKTIKEFK